jgi:hypothetical protein
VEAALISGEMPLRFAAVRTGRKPHFEPVAAHLGWLLVLVALSSGVEAEAGETAFRAGLLVVGAGLAAVAFRHRRFSLFGMGVVAAYVGLSAIVVAAISNDLAGFLWFSVTGIVVLVGLLVAHHAIRAKA